MKKSLQWIGIFALLALFNICVDININKSNISPTSEGQIRIINLFIACALIFVIIRFIIVRKLRKK
jgi:hypothetical protein